MKDLILFPFNGNSREAIAVIEEINSLKKTWNVLGFIDDNPAIHGTDYFGYKVIGGKEQLKKFSDASVLAVPGHPNDYINRDRAIANLNIGQDRFCTIIHPKASICKQTFVGHNTLIMAGVVTTANIHIGKHCVILPNTVISHDSHIDDYCIIGSNVSISGGVRIHPRCYIGAGSKIIQEIHIGEGSLVGLGSAVIKSIEPFSVVVGNPAKFLRRSKT